MFVDFDALLADASPHGLVGDNLFCDFLHPNLRAHQLMAAALADVLRANDVPLPHDRWRTDGYSEPSPDALLAADPKLRAREHASRSASCWLALRRDCAVAEAEAALAADPTYLAARFMLDGLDPQKIPR